MSSPDPGRRNYLDRYIDLALKIWLNSAVAPRDVRRLVLRRAAHPEVVEVETQEVPIHLLTRLIPGEYRDVQHRLARRNQFYGSPLMLGALSLIS